MTFIDTLRNSRSSKTSIIHQFLTNYDPKEAKYYLFVEGDPDRAFYHAKLRSYLKSSDKLLIYNCEGKRNVYLAFDDIRTRYPQISRALFFVDKDIDDIIGKPWPSDPRIFTTDVYSIENYAAVKECIEGYIRNYMKFKGVEIEISTIISKFVEEQSRFHRLILPIMAWIVLTRRMGFSVNLNDINLAELFEVKECTICRIPKRKTLSYLMKVTQTKKECSWRALRQTAAELKRLSPKLYIRGKFEAWWFVVFVASAYQSLLKVAKESRGSVSVTLPITNGNFIPVLAEMTPPVPRLSTFAEFHFRDMVPSNPEPAVRSVRRLWWHHH